MVTSALIEATIDGTGPLHKTPIFPCFIFQWDKDLNAYPGTPNYDLFKRALYCTSKRFYPNYANCNWSTDIAGRMKDVEHKRKCLAKLKPDKMEKLVEWVKENPKAAAQYKMYLRNGEIVIDENEVLPVEIMSTMGKRKLQPI